MKEQSTFSKKMLNVFLGVLSIEIYFTKMHGNGNDFIIIDNRISITEQIDVAKFVKTICRRNFHIGADGVIFLERITNGYVTMRYFNADGSEGEMCGNGARCFAKYVFDKGLVPKQMTLKTKSGLYGLTIIDDATVEITFPSYQVEEIKQIPDAAGGKIVYSVMVGVPHAVFFADAINKIATFEYENFARKIRYNKGLFPNGTNVNMVERISANRIYVRTYERGVERETYACGTGAIASSIIVASLKYVQPPVHVMMKGGELVVSFREQNGTFTNVKLTGRAETVFEGRFHIEVD